MMSDPPPSGNATFEQVLAFNTPENVVFGYTIAGIGSRFLAAAVDTLLILLLQLAANLTLILVVSLIAGESLSEISESRSLSVLAAVFGLLAFAFLWGYYIFFELLWNGQSPGKRWVGLRVIQQNGAPIDVAAALIRNLVRIVDFLPLYYGLGVLSMFFDRQSRRLGDFAAGTLVVYDQGSVTLEDLAREARQLERSMQIAPLTAPGGRIIAAPRRPRLEHVSLARSFLGRRHELYNRAELAIFLAQRILAELESAEPALDEATALAFLKQVAGREAGPATENNLD